MSGDLFQAVFPRDTVSFRRCNRAGKTFELRSSESGESLSVWNFVATSVWNYRVL
jgi:hypothetical protein